jgi:hypothetical protein
MNLRKRRPVPRQRQAVVPHAVLTAQTADVQDGLVQQPGQVTASLLIHELAGQSSPASRPARLRAAACTCSNTSAKSSGPP